jgi:hypothetical protein
MFLILQLKTVRLYLKDFGTLIAENYFLFQEGRKVGTPSLKNKKFYALTTILRILTKKPFSNLKFDLPVSYTRMFYFH